MFIGFSWQQKIQTVLKDGTTFAKKDQKISG